MQENSYKNAYIYGHNTTMKAMKWELSIQFMWKCLAARRRTEFCREMKAALILIVLLIKCIEKDVLWLWCFSLFFPDKSTGWTLFMNLFKASVAVTLHWPRGKCQQHLHCLTSSTKSKFKESGGAQLQQLQRNLKWITLPDQIHQSPLENIKTVCQTDTKNNKHQKPKPELQINCTSF